MGVKQNFIMDSKLVKIKDALNDDFLNLEIYSISEGENVNGFSFTYESMKKSLPTFFNKFILGFFTQRFSQDGNFEEHNADLKYDYELSEEYFSYIGKNAERAIGLIRESDTVEIVKKNKKRWIRVTAAILTKYNREIVKYLLKNNKQKISVEITILESHKKDGIEVIDSFVLDGITILGYYEGTTIPCEEGIEGAHLTLTDFMDTEDFKNQKKFLEEAYLSNKENLEEESETEENNNERKAEITFKKKEGDEKSMTYTQKRETLEKALYTVLKEYNSDEERECCCPWICDFTDECVIAAFYGKYFKINYTMVVEDEKTAIVFDFENKTEMEQAFVEKKEETVVVGETSYTLASLRENFVSKIEENEKLVKEKASLESIVMQLQQAKFTKEYEEKLKSEDEPHEDEHHEDEHHEDESHEDEHHEDESHEDESHEDESHEDESHEDEPHEDEHHEDEHHEDEHHEDESHEDEPHEDESHEDEHHEDEEFESLKNNFECAKEEFSKRLAELEAEKQNYIGRNQVLETELNSQKQNFAKIKSQLLREHGENLIVLEETLTKEEVNFVKNSLNSKINDGTLDSDDSVKDYVNTEIAKIFYSHARQNHDTSFSFSKVTLPKFSQYNEGDNDGEDKNIKEAKEFINILNNN